ncbi:NAD-dependent epimerase/dehydratase family protein [soil metagenome]
MAVHLVTGGEGFIGSALVDLLIEEGHEVRVVDALDPSAHDGPSAWRNAEATYLTADLADVDVWRHLLRGVDAVSHQAARVGLGVDFGDVRRYVHDNDAGTAALLWALHDTGFSGRLVVASSMVVYGEGRYRCDAHGVVRPGPRTPEALEAGRFEPPCPRCGADLIAEEVPEDAPVDPRNVYATTKLASEHLALCWGREHGRPVAALRYHNVYGPRMPNDTPYAGVAAIFRSRLAAGLAPLVFEDGGQRRNFIHVADVARANHQAMVAAVDAHGPFNIASGEVHTIGEMATALAAATAGGPHPTVTGGFRLGDVRHVFASPERARTALAFTARVGFAEGMAAFATDPLRTTPPA